MILKNLVKINDIVSGAPTRTRTANLLITNQLLYQLSYEGTRAYLFKNNNLRKQIIPLYLILTRINFFLKY